MKRPKLESGSRKKSSPPKIKTLISPEEHSILKKGASKLNLRKLKIKPKETAKSRETHKRTDSKQHKNSIINPLIKK